MSLKELGIPKQALELFNGLEDLAKRVHDQIGSKIANLPFTKFYKECLNWVISGVVPEGDGDSYKLGAKRVEEIVNQTWMLATSPYVFMFGECDSLRPNEFSRAQSDRVEAAVKRLGNALSKMITKADLSSALDECLSECLLVCSEYYVSPGCKGLKDTGSAGVEHHSHLNLQHFLNLKSLVQVAEDLESTSRSAEVVIQGLLRGVRAQHFNAFIQPMKTGEPKPSLKLDKESQAAKLKSHINQHKESYLELIEKPSMVDEHRKLLKNF